MFQVWMAERMAEEHRRDLGGRARGASNDPGGEAKALVDAAALAARADPARATGVALRVVRTRPAPDRRSTRRPVGHQVGTWLIRAGTRLGGASMRPS
jgi:hypothetical protein